jgi:hypothetical protein
MAGLKIDDRGYPIPWFVGYHKGKPEFRCMDWQKWAHAVKWKVCWVCGNKLHKPYVFVAGPMCGINRTSSEPPCHLECAQYSARNCPFLNDPGMCRREDDFTHANSGNVAGIGLLRNPGVVLLWVTKNYDLFDDGRGGKLLLMGEPERTEWYCKGRQATRAEIEHSIETGVPALEAVARMQPGAVPALQAAVARFQKYLPEAK